MAAPVSKSELLSTYRRLYRTLMHVVQYSRPQRYVVRDSLREAFRKEEPSSFDRGKISRTLEFLEAAAREKGIEHKIMKNLIHVRWSRQHTLRHATYQRLKPQRTRQIAATAYDHYDMNLAMLNYSLGLCLR